MKAVLLFCASIAIIYARPDPRPQFQKLSDAVKPYILRQQYDPLGIRGYIFNVDTSDGFHHGAVAEPKGPEPDAPLTVKGTYSYIGSDGVNYTVEYSADENGYQAAGDHIPKAASIGKVGQLGVPSAALASLAGGGIG